jgi:hypothetical protein
VFVDDGKINKVSVNDEEWANVGGRLKSMSLGHLRKQLDELVSFEQSDSSFEVLRELFGWEGPTMGLITRELTEEQVKWLNIMENFKNRTVEQMFDDIQIGGFWDRSAHEELQLLGEIYGPDEDEDDE